MHPGVLGYFKMQLFLNLLLRVPKFFQYSFLIASFSLKLDCTRRFSSSDVNVTFEHYTRFFYNFP